MRASWETRRRQIAFTAVAGLVLANCSCLAVAAGAAAGGTAAGYAYYKGKICRSYPASFADVWAAAQTALPELGMPLDSVEKNGSEGTICSRTADGTTVRLFVEFQPSRIPAEGMVTQLCVRVATFGDDTVSQRILDQVGYHLVPAARMGPPLPTGPPAAVSAPTAPPPAAAQPVVPPQTAPPPLLPPEPIPSGAQPTSTQRY
jgi:hypothetical protein